MEYNNRTPILTIDFNYTYSVEEDKMQFENRVSISLNAIRRGFISEIGSSRLGILFAVLSFMNRDGKAFPSQRKLAERAGVSKNTVNKSINELLDTKFEGVPILYRTMVKDGFHQKSVYSVSSAIITSTEEAEALRQAEKNKPMNSKDVASFFMDVYEEEFSKKYVVSWGRELSLIKQKLIPSFNTDKEMKAVIEIAVKEYQDRWGSDKYPLPTIAMLCTWLSNEAYGVYKKRNEKEEKHKERMATAEKQDDTDRALEEL